MRGYVLVGIIFWLICRSIELKYLGKKMYANFSKFISVNKSDWEIISDEIIQKQDITSLNGILKRENNIYLVKKETSIIKTQMLSNGKKREVTEVQYMVALKKLEKQDVFYTFNIDACSIYYRFAPPYEDYMLWIHIE